MSRQLLNQETREQQVLVRRRPHLRFFGTKPVRLGLLLQVANRLAHTGQRKGGAPERGDARYDQGLALIEPGGRGAQRLAAIAYVDTSTCLRRGSRRGP